MIAVTPNKAQGAILAELCHRCAKDVFIIIYQLEIVQGALELTGGKVASLSSLGPFFPHQIWPFNLLEIFIYTTKQPTLVWPNLGR